MMIDLIERIELNFLEKSLDKNKRYFYVIFIITTMLSHIKGWTKQHHYCSIGGQCGQSCPCCRAEVYLSNIDQDAWFGACEICLKNNKNKNSYKNK